MPASRSVAAHVAVAVVAVLPVREAALHPVMVTVLLVKATVPVGAVVPVTVAVRVTD